MSHGGPVRDHVSFVDALREQGLLVDPLGAANGSTLGIEGTTLRLTAPEFPEGALVESYDYRPTGTGPASRRNIEDDAARLAAASRQEQAHVFRSGDVLVLYRGADATLLSLLSQLLGAEVDS